MANILVIRFSSLGDVALTVPLLTGLAARCPEDRFLVLTKPPMAALFAECPSNVQVIVADFKRQYHQVTGLFRFFKVLRRQSVQLVCDLHGVLRSYVLDCLFFLSGVPVYCINKDRKTRRQLTRRKNKRLKPLKSSYQQYVDVMMKAGLPASFTPQPVFKRKADTLSEIEAVLGPKKQYWVGIAPFARHEAKMYPLHLMEEVIKTLVADARINVFLLGGGDSERKAMKVLKEQYPALLIHPFQTLSQELKLISCMDAVISMDSANMHLASLAGVPVVSIWGATHPFAGFAPLFQPDSNQIQLDLPCRPCSVFGNKRCYRGDHACMEQIDPSTIVQKIYALLSL
jgi:ADP-heptose:LPS heptosyltransferase